MTGKTRQFAVVAAALFNVGINALAGAGLLFGRDTGAVSDSIRTGVTPAGWAFSIWSVIFIGVLVFAVYQARPAARDVRYDGLAAPFIVANLLNGSWQFAWLTRSFGLSVIIIVGVLASLITLYVRLDQMGMTKGERWALGVPISLFLAWLSVATALNISVALAAAGWEGSGVWPPLVVLAVASIGATLLSKTGDIAFGAVLVWAFTAIYAANVDSPGQQIGLVLALGVGVAAFVIATFAAIRRGNSALPVTS